MNRRPLFMSEATVKTCVSRMLTKRGLANRPQAAILAPEARWRRGRLFDEGPASTR